MLVRSRLITTVQALLLLLLTKNIDLQADSYGCGSKAIPLTNSSLVSDTHEWFIASWETIWPVKKMGHYLLLELCLVAVG